MRFVSESTQNITSYYDPKLDFWKKQQYPDQLYGRTYVDMIKASASELIEVETEKFLQELESYSNGTSPLVNEILLDVLQNIPIGYSDYAINWLIEKPHTRFFNYTGILMSICCQVKI